MIKSIYLLICLLSCYCVSSQAFLVKRNGILGVCAYSEFKPISYDHGKGYEAFVVRKIAKKLGLKVVFYPIKIYNKLWLSPSNKHSLCDIAIGGISKTKQRELQGATFSLPTISFSQSLLIRNVDHSKFNSICDFSHSKIGVIPATTGAQYVIKRLRQAGLNEQLIIVNYPTEKDLLLALNNKEIDAIARGEIGNDYQSSINKNVSTILKMNFRESFSFALDNKNVRLIQEVNSALILLKRCSEIYYKYWLKSNIRYISRSEI